MRLETSAAHILVVSTPSIETILSPGLSDPSSADPGRTLCTIGVPSWWTSIATPTLSGGGRARSVSVPRPGAWPDGDLAVQAVVVAAEPGRPLWRRRIVVASAPAAGLGAVRRPPASAPAVHPRPAPLLRRSSGSSLPNESMKASSFSSPRTFPSSSSKGSTKPTRQSWTSSRGTSASCLIVDPP